MGKGGRGRVSSAGFRRDAMGLRAKRGPTGYPSCSRNAHANLIEW